MCSPRCNAVFPDGRIVGHRALRKYYKQRARPESSSTAIVAAKNAAGERLYQGRVVNISGNGGLAGMKGGAAAAAGNGILVPSKDGGGFSALSLCFQLYLKFGTRVFGIIATFINPEQK